MSRGETQGALAAATLFNSQYKDWLEERQVRVIVQYADFRDPNFSGVPTIMELADTEEAKAVFKFLVSLSTIDRAYVAPPGVPVDRQAILRKGFDARVSDPAFRADAEKRAADLLPMPGEELGA